MTLKCCWTLLFRAILLSWVDPQRSFRMRFWMRDCSLLYRVFEYPSKWSVYLQVYFGCCMAGATWRRCRLSTRSVYTMQPCTSLQCQFIQCDILESMSLCLGVTCDMHFWQNDQDLLRGYYFNTAVERIPKWVSTESYPGLRRKFSRLSCRDSNRLTV